MAPPLVLDANAFSARGFREWLRGYHGDKILPAVAYAELGIHVRRKLGKEAFDATLHRAGVEVEWLRAELADVAIGLGLRHGGWDARARDYLIGAHAASAPRVMVTDNAGDFRFLGDRVRTPAALMASPPK
jgi:predicted nucleic acid-binding protein